MKILGTIKSIEENMNPLNEEAKKDVLFNIGTSNDRDCKSFC